MDKRALQTYSVWAKDNLEKQIEVSLKTLGINGDDDIRPARMIGDMTVIEGDATSYPASLRDKRQRIINLILAEGYKNVIEEFAYTWFNRIIALRFMEVHDFLDHGFRVLSNRGGGIEPEIVRNFSFVKEELGLDAGYCIKLRDENKIEELFRYILLKQCKALSGLLPMLFADDDDCLELLLPKNLLKGETAITRLMEIPEESFLEDVEIIGWLYQFYVADRRQQYREAKQVTKSMIPTLTQVFTPDWIVRYMAENSVGRLWLESYPDSALRSEMKYYVDDPEQPEDVMRKLDAVRYRDVAPEDIRIIEPCCGSGHVLVYVFDLLYKMYEERGYQKRDIPTLILSKNLTGLDIDKRASQLAAFSLIMKARSVNSKFFSSQYYVHPRVYEIYDSRPLELMDYKEKLRDTGVVSGAELKEILDLVDIFKNGKTVGSLLKVEPMNFDRLRDIISRVECEIIPVFLQDFYRHGLPYIRHLITLAEVLSAKYDVLITNPPYLGISKIEANAKEYLISNYPNSKSDMFAMFMEAPFVKQNGFRAIVNPDSWMFLVSFEDMRRSIISDQFIVNMVHLGMGAFDAVVQTTSFVIRNSSIPGNGVYFRLVDSKDKETEFVNSLLTKRGGVQYIVDIQKCSVIPGKPVAYWVSNSFIEAFEKGKLIGDLLPVKKGLDTGNNDKYLRQWYEVPFNKIGLGYKSSQEFTDDSKKWAPHDKGGEFHRWYGNNEWVINWENNGFELHNSQANLRSEKYYFSKAITWSSLSSGAISFRYSDYGAISNTAGSSMYPNSNDIFYLGLLNSSVAQLIYNAISPTLNYSAGPISQLPVINADDGEYSKIKYLVRDNIYKCKSDWDSFEESWDFKKHPLI